MFIFLQDDIVYMARYTVPPFAAVHHILYSRLHPSQLHTELPQTTTQPIGDNSAVTALGVLFPLSLLLLLVLTVVVVVQAVMLKRARSGSEYMWHSAIHTSEWE